ncbi:putative porin [Cupriavidus gilardii J11]|uniref:Putative porin n=1 Tax=Cupriavidus gilardii J11 TaxID=936133 RepID=A0A562BQS9_9BURK|nr:porin [Cupriavidus gilardii]TWG87250.1 putative porin [Cupriavidus gilardii J11]
MYTRMKPAAKLAIAAAAACASTGALAQSSVTLYGQVDSFVGSTKANGGDRAYVVGAGGMQTSYWGMKGTEDLGNGLKAIFDLNGFYRVDNGRAGRFDADGMFTRSAFVGLQSERAGTLRLGRNTTPYFLSTILFNPLVDSYVFSPTVFHTYLTTTGNGLYDPGIIGDSGWSNSVVYSSPKLGGLTMNLIYAFGEQAGDNGRNKWGGNLLYFNGPFAATVAFQQVKFNNTPGDVTAPASLAGFDKQNAVQAGMTYDFKVVKLYAQGQYIKSDVNSPSGDIKHANGQIGASVPIGAGSLLMSYIYGKVENDVAEFKRHTAALAYDYNLSKRTDVYAAYFYDKVSGLSHGDSYGVGIRHRF